MSDRRRGLWLALAASPVVLVACDPGWGLRARVLSAPSCAASGAAPLTPVAGARLAVECPGEAPRALGETDAAGKLGSATLGFLPGCEIGRCLDDHAPPSDARASCHVSIQKPGLITQRYPLATFCSEYRDERCVGLSIAVVLVADGGASPAASR